MYRVRSWRTRSPPEYTPGSENLSSLFRPESRTLASCAAALAALALHALVIGPAVWPGGASRQPNERKYPGAAAMQWVVLENSSGSSALLAPPSLRPMALKTIGLTEALAKLPLRVLAPDAADSAGAQPDGQSGLGALYGRYLGQIQARIDRAWLRPRVAIGAPVFRCQVQLDQDTAGRVLATTLVDCNGGSRWQLSLVHAIEASSPLPAPPDSAFFVHHVLLTFRAVAYSRAASAQLYEPPGAVVPSGDPGERAAPSEDAIQALGEAMRGRSGKGVQLRIEGSKVEVEPDRK